MRRPSADIFASSPGEGNLDVRAYIAAIVGPQRVAHGARSLVLLGPTMPAKISSSAGQAGRIAYIAVALPADTAGPLAAMFSSGESMGVQTSAPCRLTGTLGALAGVSYSAVLLPGEELYGQAIGAAFNVVVSTVWF